MASIKSVHNGHYTVHFMASCKLHSTEAHCTAQDTVYFMTSPSSELHCTETPKKTKDNAQEKMQRAICNVSVKQEKVKEEM